MTGWSSFTCFANATVVAEKNARQNREAHRRTKVGEEEEPMVVVALQ
jgi:hypothetical protein